ncbi:MAG: hypothetical protein RMK99_12575, partial [Anaerolineales bacterium]|nr:hypothetical protein [Anaerolineales bacterium]
WAPDLAFGYGYPVFNYFPYSSHYLVALLILTGLSALTAYKIICAAALVGSAWSAYAFGHELFDESSAGLVTGVAYLYSPYLLYDAHIRGSVPESLALALLPLALLHLRRAAYGQARSAVWAGLALAACIFAHHGVTLQVMPFLAAYAAFELWQFHKRSAASIGQSLLRTPLFPSPFSPLPSPFFLLPASFLLAFLLSAFFWLPALLESQYVQTERGTLNGGMLYTNNFLSFGELFAWPRLPVDPDLLNPPVVRPLPLAALLFAGPALIRWWGRGTAASPKSEQSNSSPISTLYSPLSTLLFFTLASALAVLLIHPVSRPLWDNLPLLRLTLFPWRLLGPISLFVAVVAGALFVGRRTAEGRPQIAAAHGIRNTHYATRFTLLLVIVVLVIAGLPFASPPFEPVPPRPGLADMAAFEIPPDFIGTTTVGEYLPRAVQQLPADVGARRDLSRRPRFSAPGAQVTHTPLSPTQDAFTVSAAAPVTFIYNRFYFPGWRAMLDGKPVALRVTAPEGLMALDLPPGTHTLTFELADTWPRTLGNLLSVVGVAVAGIALLLSRRHDLESRKWEVASDEPGFTFYFLLSALALALFRPLLYDAGLTPLLQRGLTSEGLRHVAVPLNHNFADELTLLGWDTLPSLQQGEGVRVGADDAFTVNLYWKANRPLGVPYGFEVKLVDAHGFIWSERETLRPRNWRFTPGTDRWPLDQYILDPYVITPLAGTPPGEYRLQVEVFSHYDLRSLGKLQFGTVYITAPSRRACEGAIASAVPGLQFVAFSQLQAAPGDDITVTTCWRGVPSPFIFNLKHDNTLFLDGNDHIVLDTKIEIIDPKTVTRHQLSVRLPADLDTGRYTWTLQVGDESFELGVLEVFAPARVYTAPPVGQRLDADLGPAALYGLDAPTTLTPGDVLPLTLVWRADELFADSYHVFVHLTDADGVIVAQSDGAPANGTRRTTGWLPGEYVVDPRTLSLPAGLTPGAYTLTAGLYRPDTGTRLTTPEFPEGRVWLTELPFP